MSNIDDHAPGGGETNENTPNGTTQNRRTSSKPVPRRGTPVMTSPRSSTRYHFIEPSDSPTYAADEGGATKKKKDSTCTDSPLGASSVPTADALTTERNSFFQSPGMVGMPETVSSPRQMKAGDDVDWKDTNHASFLFPVQDTTTVSLKSPLPCSTEKHLLPEPTKTHPLVSPKPNPTNRQLDKMNSVGDTFVDKKARVPISSPDEAIGKAQSPKSSATDTTASSQSVPVKDNRILNKIIGSDVYSVEQNLNKFREGLIQEAILSFEEVRVLSDQESKLRLLEQDLSQIASSVQKIFKEQDDLEREADEIGELAEALIEVEEKVNQKAAAHRWDIPTDADMKREESFVLPDKINECLDKLENFRVDLERKMTQVEGDLGNQVIESFLSRKSQSDKTMTTVEAQTTSLNGSLSQVEDFFEAHKN